MADWYVGQKVVCIAGPEVWNDETWSTWFKRLRDGKKHPVKGAVYVITKVGIAEDDVVLYLSGMRQDWWHKAYNFRPLVSQDTDISVFTRLLDKLPSRVPENA